jgi:hypothetical protein
MYADPPVPARTGPRGDGYLDRAWPVRQHSPEGRGAAVAEECIAEGEDGRHRPSLEAQGGMSRRIDATVDPVQVTAADASRNRVV